MKAWYEKSDINKGIRTHPPGNTNVCDVISQQSTTQVAEAISFKTHKAQHLSGA